MAENRTARKGGEQPPSPLDESKQALSLMATPEFRKEMSGLIRSRSPLIYLVSTEEKRVLEYFKHYSKLGGFRTFIWDCYNGLLNIVNMQPAGLVSGEATDPVTILDWIVKEATEEAEASLDPADTQARSKSRGNIYVLLDFHRFLRPCTPDVERRLRTLTRMDSNTVVVLVGPQYETTPALDKDVRVIDFPYPNNGEIKIALYSAVQGVYGKGSPTEKETQEKERDVINAVTGLSYGELTSAFAKSIVMHKGLDIPTLLKEKQEVIRKTGVLEYFNPKVSLEDVGGLGNLTSWLQERKCLFHEDAIEYGLTQPKGALLIGVPGSGKSLAAKATAAAYQIPLLRLDFGALFGSLVGESERQARQAIQVAERVAPCVLWADEIDKGLSGHQSSGRSDSGVTSRVISTFLTWMQEKKAPVFFMCTANNHDAIPTEFMRAGRFDEVFFVDLPTKTERADIIRKLIKRKGREPKDFDAREIANRSEGYTGAELEKALEVALLRGFREGRRPIRTDDIVDALVTFQPLSKTRPEVIEAMRIWAKSRCLMANTPDVTPGSAMNTTRSLITEEE